MEIKWVILVIFAGLGEVGFVQVLMNRLKVMIERV